MFIRIDRSGEKGSVIRGDLPLKAGGRPHDSQEPPPMGKLLNFA